MGWYVSLGMGRLVDGLVNEIMNGFVDGLMGMSEDSLGYGLLNGLAGTNFKHIV